MSPETVDQLVDVLANLMNECHDVALKAAAAERIFQQQTPQPYSTHTQKSWSI
jgi:hypothetical protein